jgi:hypothetical protein
MQNDCFVGKYVDNMSLVRDLGLASPKNSGFYFCSYHDPSTSGF